MPTPVLANWLPTTLIGLSTVDLFVLFTPNFRIDWGDGTAEQTVTTNNPSVVVQHTYQFAGDYNVVVTENPDDPNVIPARLTALMHAFDSQVFLGGSDVSDVAFGNNQDNRILLRGGNDYALGFGGDDVINGGAGFDLIVGGDGNDLLIGGSEGDLMSGGADNDTLRGDAGDDDLFGDAGDDRLEGGSQEDQLSAGDGDDKLFGDADDDELFGGPGNDVLYGGTGADLIDGGEGRDQLFGGDGADEFYFEDEEDSPNVTGQFDTIRQFSLTEGDKLKFDFTGGDGLSLQFIGSTAFSGDGDEVSMGQVRVVFSAVSTTVLADLDGDGVADLRVTIAGVHALTADDFLFA